MSWTAEFTYKFAKMFWKSKASVKADVPWEQGVINQIFVVVWVPAFHWKGPCGSKFFYACKPKALKCFYSVSGRSLQECIFQHHRSCLPLSPASTIFFQNIAWHRVFWMFRVKRTVMYTFFLIKSVQNTTVCSVVNVMASKNLSV